jgi:hypothetical protein
MNPTRQSKVDGTLSITLGGMNFERPLSENEADFFADVTQTALRNYCEARLQNRVDQLPSETLKGLEEPEL